jgi:hypothetical protein
LAVDFDESLDGLADLGLGGFTGGVESADCCATAAPIATILISAPKPAPMKSDLVACIEIS